MAPSLLFLKCSVRTRRVLTSPHPSSFPNPVHQRICRTVLELCLFQLPVPDSIYFLLFYKTCLGPVYWETICRHFHTMLNSPPWCSSGSFSTFLHLKIQNIFWVNSLFLCFSIVLLYFDFQLFILYFHTTYFDQKYPSFPALQFLLPYLPHPSSFQPLFHFLEHSDSCNAVCTCICGRLSLVHG